FLRTTRTYEDRTERVQESVTGLPCLRPVLGRVRLGKVAPEQLQRTPGQEDRTRPIRFSVRQQGASGGNVVGLDGVVGLLIPLAEPGRQRSQPRLVVYPQEDQCLPRPIGLAVFAGKSQERGCLLPPRLPRTLIGQTVQEIAVGSEPDSRFQITLSIGFLP